MAMTMTFPNNSSAKRITVQIPTSSGDAIEAWVYLPEGSGPHPAVVMAHGIGGIKAGGLAPFAERFREEGFAAIAFDYRNFGGSGGQARHLWHHHAVRGKARCSRSSARCGNGR
jgi:dienelactone hydrolase